MEKIGVYYAANKPVAAAVAERAIRVIEHSGAQAVCCEPGHDACLPDGLGALLAIGGDGTILHAAVMAARVEVPVLGVNVGRVGFLSVVNQDGLDDAVRRTLLGHYHTDERLLLDISADGRSALALNELLITRAPDDIHVLHLDVFVDGLLAARWVSDGLIVSTPTGASAYSLSAGGPLVAPNADVFLITPVCAHSLSAKPIVVPASAAIRVQIEEPKGALFADGRPFLPKVDRRECEVRKAPQAARFIRFSQLDFFKLLRSKLM